MLTVASHVDMSLTNGNGKRHSDAAPAWSVKRHAHITAAIRPSAERGN